MLRRDLFKWAAAAWAGLWFGKPVVALPAEVAVLPAQKPDPSLWPRVITPDMPLTRDALWDMMKAWNYDHPEQEPTHLIIPWHRTAEVNFFTDESGCTLEAPVLQRDGQHPLHGSNVMSVRIAVLHGPNCYFQCCTPPFEPYYIEFFDYDITPDGRPIPWRRVITNA